MKQNVSTLSSWLKKKTSLHPYFEEDKLIQVLSNQHKKQKAYFQTDQVLEQADRDGSKAFLPTQSPAWCFPPLYEIDLLKNTYFLQERKCQVVCWLYVIEKYIIVIIFLLL